VLKLDQLAWHRAMGNVLDTLDQNDFWLRLTRLLTQYIQFDSWVALRFNKQERPLVLAEIPLDDGSTDSLFEEYLNGLYLLDPFYIAATENRREGLIHLDDVAPDRFKSTEYYQRYFRLNIGEDEVQLNCLVDDDATLCLSLGSHQRFTPSDMALLGVLSQWVVPLLRQRWRYERGVLGSPAKQLDASAAPHTLNAKNFRLSDTTLSARELEVGHLMLSGYSSKEIARRLGISVETIKVHRKHLYAKLNINSQHELFSLFMQDTVREGAGIAVAQGA
jgi:DNA-binding CsgD family transcriptional regulator